MSTRRELFFNLDLTNIQVQFRKNARNVAKLDTEHAACACYVVMPANQRSILIQSSFHIYFSRLNAVLLLEQPRVRDPLEAVTFFSRKRYSVARRLYFTKPPLSPSSDMTKYCRKGHEITSQPLSSSFYISYAVLHFEKNKKTNKK